MQLLKRLGLKTQQKILDSYTDKQLGRIKYEWELWGRPNQLEPKGNDWLTWVLHMGRRGGKTRTGAEWIRKYATSGKVQDIGMVATTAPDIRDVMVEGPAGIKTISPPWEGLNYQPSKRRITWPNGCKATLLSADDPEEFRGKGFELLWGDEIGVWKHPEYCYALLLLCLSEVTGGIDQTKMLLTLTPNHRKPESVKLLKRILAKSTTVTSTGSTYDNRENLSEKFFREIVDAFKGTTYEQEEIHGSILEQIEGALWNRQLIDRDRFEVAPELARVIIGVDPATTSKQTSSETGIVVAAQGREKEYNRNHYYILEDFSLRGSPEQWGSQVCYAYDKYKADLIVAETNQGGDLVVSNMHHINPNLPVKKVHAKRGKYLRAEPISTLSQQGRVHVINLLPDLEDQMCEWVPGEDSPDRLDGMVYAMIELTEGHESIFYASGMN
jgi:phage terminase large subunit-like protein